MSYNVDTWKTKELNNLRLPLSAFFEQPRSDWHPHIAREHSEVDHRVALTLIDSCIIGVIEHPTGARDDKLLITDIDIHGEGSGSFLHYVLEPALRKSTGRLVAARVWERGDSIDELTVVDGVISTRPIEL